MSVKPGSRPKHGVCARFAPSALRWPEVGLGRRGGGGGQEQPQHARVLWLLLHSLVRLEPIPANSSAAIRGACVSPQRKPHSVHVFLKEMHGVRSERRGACTIRACFVFLLLCTTMLRIGMPTLFFTERKAPPPQYHTRSFAGGDAQRKIRQNSSIGSGGGGSGSGRQCKQQRQQQQQQQSSRAAAATADVSYAGVPTAASYKHNVIVRNRVRGVGGSWLIDASSSSNC